MKLPTMVRRRSPGWRGDAPEAFLLDGRGPNTRTLVACVGDSITQGRVSANYVEALRARWAPEGVQFVNGGVDGDLAFNVAQRLDAVIACRPDTVTLLVGTNDVNAQFDGKWQQRYRKNQDLPVAPTLEWYAEQIDIILTRLQAETDAHIVVLDVPPLGEDLDGRMNALVTEYNAGLHAVADRHSVPCLPLHDRLVDSLPADHTPPRYEGDISAIMQAGFSHMVLRRSWDEVSRRAGLAALTDHIHLNDRSAAVVADLISDVLDDQLRDAA